MTPFERRLLEAATRPYRSAGRYAYHFAQGKLRHDPAFFALIREKLIPSGARVLDLGCGQGLLLSMLIAARRQFDAGFWPPDWPVPPRELSLYGIDLLPRDIRRARTALREVARFEIGDLRSVPFPASDVVVILDVLHYIDESAQQQVLERVAEALSPGGRLLLRVADTQAGMRFALTHLGDRFGTLMRGEFWPRHRHRPMSDWIALLERLGFEVASRPMSRGTPFSNVLLVAERHRRDAGERLPL